MKRRCRRASSNTSVASDPPASCVIVSSGMNSQSPRSITGAVRRVLDHNSAATQRRQLMADGVAILNDQARQSKGHADELEVSPEA